MVEDLPVGYYLDNFNYVLDFVTAQYEDLLTPEEVGWAHGFRRLSLDARRLYVRLCGRKGPLFRDDKLNYPEIGDIHAAIDELAAAGYLDFATDADTAALLALLTRREMIELRIEGVHKSLSREELLERLAEVLHPGIVHGKTPFRTLRPLQLEVLHMFLVLFFGNDHQDFTDFVLRDLGISPFEQYSIHPQDRFFDDRGVLEETLQLYTASDMSHDVAAGNDPEAMRAFCDSIPAVSDARLVRRAGKIRNRIARQLERLEMFEDALALYEGSDVAPSRERRARILHRNDRIDDAVAMCRRIIDDPEDEAEYEFAVNFARRLLRKRPSECGDLPDLRSDSFRKHAIRVAQDASLGVEEQARLWFEREGHRAWYVENGLFPGLFGLAFWDIIFHPVKGAFFNPLQRGPADLFAPEFRDARRELIDRRFAEIADPERMRARVVDTFRAKYPIANHFVMWGVLSEQLLEAAFERIPVMHMVAVFHRLLRDLRNNRSGFPDLVVFPADGAYLLAEVKGPGDTLQNNQKRWLRFFDRTGVPAEVVSVEWA
jgi:hypothetical protein